MGHHVTSSDIKINGDHLDNSKLVKVKMIAAAIAAIGSLISVYLLFWGPEPEGLKPGENASGVTQGSYAYSWLFAFYFFLTLSIGGCFWTLLHNVSNSGWGTSVRRTFENLGSTFPWSAARASA